MRWSKNIQEGKISIHAPRVGSDGRLSLVIVLDKRISIHAPRVGSDTSLHVTPKTSIRFQSTLPVWGATMTWLIPLMNVLIFQSTLPVWGATGNHQDSRHLRPISIHAPRVGSDTDQYAGCSSRSDFNPRSPCGERQRRAWSHCTPMDFNPRSPCGERLVDRVAHAGGVLISIHAPRVGSDTDQYAGCSSRSDFNPRSPCGERQKSKEAMNAANKFQSTLPVWGATETVMASLRHLIISIHAPRVGSDCTLKQTQRLWRISIHAPRVGSDEQTSTR